MKYDKYIENCKSFKKFFFLQGLFFSPIQLDKKREFFLLPPPHTRLNKKKQKISYLISRNFDCIKYIF